jgi:signal transduction histidine kinase
MSAEIKDTTTETLSAEALGIELERCRKELNECQQRLEFLQKYGVLLDERTGAAALLAGENQILEMIVAAKPLATILEAICCFVDSLCDEAMATILLFDQVEKCLRPGAAPRFPPEFLGLIDGIKVGPAVGSCGTAAYLKEQVIVSDIETNPFWVDFRGMARAYQLRAGWSTPILSSAGEVLGVFGIYWREPRSPAPEHHQIINQITHLAAVAIERKQSTEALRISEDLGRGQAEALTQALDALAREPAPDKIAQHALSAITSKLGGHCCSVWLRDEASGLMVFELAMEDGEFKTKKNAALAAVGPSLPAPAVWPWSEIFRTSKPSVLEDIRTGPDFPWRARLLAQSVNTVLMVPMVITGSVEGVIGIGFTEKRAFRADEMDLPQALANQTMLAIQLARLSAQSRQAAIIAERNRMARDIHDTLAQGFTGVIIQLEAVEEALSQERPEKATEHLNRAGDLARQSLREARRSVQALRPLALEEQPLGDAFKDSISKMTAGTTVHAEVTLEGKPRRLAEDWEANLLHIGQEVLTNVLRHANAEEFKARLKYNDAEVRLDLRDNGRGFDLHKKYDGFGLQGINERVESMGGSLLIESARGKGTSVFITLPFPQTSTLESL